MTKYDYSMLDDFARCPLYYYFAHILHRRKIKSDAAQQYGKYIGKACDCFFRGEPLEKALGEFLLGVPEDLDEKRTLKTAELIIREYYNRYKLQPFDEIMGAELMLNLPINDEILFWGRLDKLIKWAYGISAIDHKTTSYYISEYVKRIDRMYQFTGYNALLKSLFPDSYGVIVDIIYIPRPLKTKPIEPQFDRVTVIKNEKQIEDWKHWVCNLHNQIKNGICFEQYRSCYDYNKACPYLSVCENPISLEEKTVYIRESIDFEDYIWQPWEEINDRDNN